MITEQEKVRARHHMGYLNVSAVQTFVAGIPANVESQFLIEGALNQILPQAEGQFRILLQRLDEVECQIDRNMENLAVSQVDEIKLREDEFKQLITRYKYWQGGIANLLAAPPNPFDQREWLGRGWGGGGGINAPVIG